MILSQIMALPKKQCFNFPSLNLQSKLFFAIFNFLLIAITLLKIIRILQAGGVLESSGPPLEDGHRDF